MLRSWAIAGLAGLVVAGCSSAAAHSGPAPQEIRLVLLPSDDGRSHNDRYEPVRSALEAALHIPVKLTRASDYSAVIEALRTKKAEVALLGPCSYVLAKREADAEAFVAGIGINRTGVYHSIITVRTDSPYHSLKDLQGAKIALVDPASTSGSLMPHYMVQQETGTELEKFFSKVEYCGTHPAAMKAVENGSVDVAAVEEFLQGIMEEKGQIKKGSLRELERSQDLPPSPLAYRHDMDPTLKQKIKAAFLGIKKLPPMPGFTGVDHFREVHDDEYVVIENLVDKLKVQREALLKK